jgi:small subunit ribosomal protein S16
MAVKIRLRRMGAKGQPSYRLVVTDSRTARDGRFIETIGFYNPRREPPEIRLDEAKALAWLERGAMPTETARSLLKKAGLWARFTDGGKLSSERRHALAARKERASARRAQRRLQPRTATAKGVSERPTAIETRSGEKKIVKKREGMPPISKGGA